MARAAIYTRISRDDSGRGEGVERQEADCRALAERRGYEDVQVFTDNDRGASTRSRKARPAYDEMMRRCRAGEFDAIIAYSSSRLTRRPREAEDILELVERGGILLHTVRSGSFDLATADGRAVARTLAAWDAAEAERTGERVRRAFDARAERGLTHGAVPFGWRREGGQEVLDEPAAGLLREAADRVLSGVSLRSTAAWVAVQGVPSPRRGTWGGVVLKQLLVRPRNAGLLVRHGEVVGRGSWPALWDEGRHLALVARLNDPSRPRARGTDPKHLLSGILRCGLCGGPCRSLRGARRADGTCGRSYACGECHRLRRSQTVVDEAVEAVVVARLARPDVPALAVGDEDAVREAMTERDGLRARLDEAADRFADGVIDAVQLERISARLRGRLEAVEARLAAAQPTGLAMLDSTVPATQAWEQATLEVKREVIRALMVPVLLPAGPGARFDVERHLRIEWRS